MNKAEREKFHQKFMRFAKSKNIEPPLSIEDMCEMLDLLGPKKFDRGVAFQLYEQMEKNRGENRVSMNEFLRVYFEAERIMVAKLEECSNMMVNLRKEREEIRENLDDALKSEILDHNGLMRDACCVINVQKIENIPPGSYYLIFFLDKYRDTGEGFSVGTRDPSLNQKFSVPTSHPRSQIEVYLMRDETTDTNFCEGYIFLKLEDYKDQKKYEEAKNFVGRKSLKTNMILRFNVQWIYSKVKYYSEGLERWDYKLNEEEKIMQEIDRDLRSIYMPLRKLDEIYPNDIDRNFRSEKPPANLNTQIKKETERVPRGSAQDTRAIMDNLKEIHKQDANENEKHLKVTQYVFIAYLVLAVCASMQRPAFLDLALSLSFICIIEEKKLDKFRAKIYLILLVFALISDAIWLILFNYRNWIVGTAKYDQNNLYGLKLASYIFSVLLLLYKGVAGFMINKISDSLPERIV